MTPTVYRAPPTGYRSQRTQIFRGTTRRFPDEGPYEIFITYTQEPVYAAGNSLGAAREKWLEVTDDIHAILWGNREQRINAKDNLDAFNIDNFPEPSGRIEIENWSRAGDQLEKAVRDYHIYASTARFEDVRDFIWERISQMNYPVSWRVKPELFYAQIESNAECYATLRQKSLIDTRDGVFYEWLQQESSHGLPPYRESPESSEISDLGDPERIPAIPGYRFPPLGFRGEPKTEDPGGTPVQPAERRNPEDGPYGIFIHNKERSSNPCPVDLVPSLKGHWDNATGYLHNLLWSRSETRVRASCESLEIINYQIVRVSFRGKVEVTNWLEAGRQLKLAIRDFHLYGSICRFEDVRDFIWERITLRNFPPEWRVKREDFAKGIKRTAESFTYLRERTPDPMDGISREQRLRGMRNLAPEYTAETPQSTDDSSSSPMESPTPATRPTVDRRQQREYGGIFARRTRPAIINEGGASGGRASTGQDHSRQRSQETGAGDGEPNEGEHPGPRRRRQTVAMPENRERLAQRRRARAQRETRAEGHPRQRRQARGTGDREPTSRQTVATPENRQRLAPLRRAQAQREARGEGEDASRARRRHQREQASNSQGHSRQRRQGTRAEETRTGDGEPNEGEPPRPRRTVATPENRERLAQRRRARARQEARAENRDASGTRRRRPREPASDDTSRRRQGEGRRRTRARGTQEDELYESPRMREELNLR